LSIAEAAIKLRKLTATNSSASMASSSLCGKWRCSLRGCRASHPRPTTRAHAFAPSRAAPLPLSHQIITCADGCHFAAQTTEMRAKGSENKVCEYMTSSLYSLILDPGLPAYSITSTLLDAGTQKAYFYVKDRPTRLSY